MTTNSQKTRELTPEESFRELYKRTAELNDTVRALISPAWGSEMGILPTDHPLYRNEEQRTPAATEATGPVGYESGPIVAALPSDDWYVEYGPVPGHPAGCHRLLGWAVHADGEVTPLDADEQGTVLDARIATNFRRVFRLGQVVGDRNVAALNQTGEQP